VMIFTGFDGWGSACMGDAATSKSATNDPILNRLLGLCGAVFIGTSCCGDRCSDRIGTLRPSLYK